mgnify:CR=1 FL=1
MPAPRVARGPAVEELVARIAGLGFDHLLIALPLLPDSAESLSLDDVQALTRVLAAHGMGLMLDLPAGCAAAHAPLLAWVEAGAAGFRALLPQRLPAATWRDVIARARAARPDLQMLAWTLGLSPAEVDPLAAAGFDRSIGSQPWWDGRAPWLAREYEGRRQVPLPTIGLVEDPERPRLAATAEGRDSAFLRRLRHRALALAATTGAGLLMPMGFETAPGADGTDEPAIAEAIALMRRCAPLAMPGQLLPLTGAGAPVAAFARAAGGDLRRAPEAALILANASLTTAASLSPDSVLAAFDGRFPDLGRVFPTGPGDALRPGRPIILAPGEVAVFAGAAVAPRPAPRPILDAAAARALPRIAIARVGPAADDGRFAVKRLAGESVTVSADILSDGHEALAAVVRWRAEREELWREAPMSRGDNDRWYGRITLAAPGRHVFVIEAWRDLFATWRDEIEKKHAAGIPIALELQEGIALVEYAAARAEGPDAERFSALLRRLAAAPDGARLHDLLAEETRLLMRRWAERTQATRTDRAYPVMADRRAAAFASWYEMFPRSAADDATRHGTFDDVIRHLPRIRAMGFDVLYFTPIHPIGRTNRKGRNNTLTAGPGDPGSPYAIGAAEGGHDALHPELGDAAAFRRLVAAAEAHGLEIALDFAIQCSPDHPWLGEHPGWFAWRPDGSLRTAENPPKKYEDIVNVDFYAPDAVPGLWTALRDVILHWVGEGVRTFRVDNPHTKPLPFWEWLIADIQARHPDVIFLSEAFTRPKMMLRLAQIGFTQSYTYFTWRNTKRELADYLTEITTTEAADVYRPHFFVNTPDINPAFLQRSGRPGHLIRAALAATLSGLWGVYNGFELCEARALPGKEEYLDSEKYEIRAWDWDRPGNIVAEITALNRIRRENPALHTHLGLQFLNCWNESILAFRKMTPDRSNLVLVAVTLDPATPQEAAFEIPLWDFGLPDDGEVEVEDLVTGHSWRWRGKVQHLRLDPAALPYAVWRLSLPGAPA